MNPGWVPQMVMEFDRVGDTVDLATAAGFGAFVTSFGAFARCSMNERGELVPMFGLVVTAQPDPEAEPFPYPVAARFLFPDMNVAPTLDMVEHQKGQVAGYMRRVAKAAKAVGAISIMETWFSTALRPDGRPKYKDFADDPDREERLILLAEHIRFAAPQFYVARITRNALGRSSAREFALQETSAVKGRFTDLLDRRRYA